MTANVGVLLSGCGFLDGAEISESVLTLLALDRRSANAICIAPRGPQASVVDHLRGEPVAGATRDVLTEAARIARGRIRDLAEVQAKDLDALVMPGGYGAAKNLCDFASKGAACTPHPEAARLLREMHAAKKPIGAICISPALVAAVLGRSAAPTLTVGEASGAAAAIEAMGAKHRASPVTECVVDEANRIVTTPAYMYDARVADVATGIDKLVAAVLAMLPNAAARGSK